MRCLIAIGDFLWKRLPKVKFIQFDGRDIQESALYCRSTLGAMDVDYSLTPKPHTRRVDGLKERLISEPHKPRPTRLHVPDRQSPHVVNLDARTTLDAFFEALAPSLRPAIEGKSLILTYPAMADASQREDYRKRIKSAASRHFNPRDIAFIEESDAVVEFLLHSGRGIELPSRDQLIPVLDWGSLTCNIALVIPILAGGRTSDVTTGDRPAALATTADCARECGGARIDQLLLQEFLREHDFQCPEQIRNALLPIIEELKVRVSREQRPVHVEVDIEALYLNDELTLPPSVSKSLTFALAPQTLRDKVKEVWHHNIRPVLDRLLERAWENIRGRRRERLSRLNINRSEGLKQIIDQIVLSGGSSNLPGVAELAAEYFDVKRERIVEVGHDFVAAVAVGAAAWRANQLNVLEATHVPASINLLPRPENNLYLVGKSGSSSVRVHEPALILRDHWEEHIAQWHEHEPTTRVRFSCPQYAIAETDSATAGSQEPEAITRGLLQPSQPWEHLKKEIKQQQNQKGARGGWATYIDPKSGQITVELRHQRSETSKVIKQQFHRFTENCLSQASPHTPSVRMSESPTHIEPSTRALGQSQSQSQVVLDFGNSKTIAVSLDNVETLLLAHLPVRQNPPAELLEHAVFDAGNEPSLVERPNESPPGTDFPQAPSQDAKVAHIAMPELPGVDSLGMQRANPPSVDSLPTHPDAIAHLIRFVRHRGMVLDDSIVKALYLSLVVRPFAVMAGPAGVGKSRLARLYGEAFAANSDGHRVAVEPSWLSSESLIPAAGWSRIYQTEYPSPELVVTVLDEFNLAPPERYLV